MTQSIDELCPAYIGENRIAFTMLSAGNGSWYCDNIDAKGNVSLPLSSLTSPMGSGVYAFHPLQLDISYERCKPEGVMLPIEITVQGPSAGSFKRKLYTKHPPIVYVFTPIEGGEHLVRIAELGHNGWWGHVKFIVGGEKLNA